MTAAQTDGAGALVREWRSRRRLSQLELAVRADVSAKHVSFIETGRSRPTRAMLLRIGEHLELPLRERNQLLLAGGFAPAYPEHPITDVPMAAVSSAIGHILAGQMPNPTLVVDRHWTMVDANPAATVLVGGCAPHLLEPPVNVLRLALHPDGMAPRTTNLDQWRAHLLDRLEHQITATGDRRLRELADEFAGYFTGPPAPRSGELMVPLRLRGDDGTELEFLSTTTVFGAARDVTVEDLAIETFFPANEGTRSALAAAEY